MWPIKSQIRFYKILFIIFILNSQPNEVNGQLPTFLHSAGNLDDRVINFGFLLEVNRPLINAYNRVNFTDPNYPDYDLAEGNRLLSIDSKSKISFTAGFLMSVRILDNLDLRLTPRVSFLGMSLQYIYNDKVLGNIYTVSKDMRSTLFEMPILFKYKGDRDANYRSYVIGGISYNTDLRNKRKYNDDDLPANSNDRFVKLKNNYLSWEIGVGLEIYNIYFKLTPEIRFSKNFGSILANKNENKFTRPLTRLDNELIRLTFYFE